MENENSNATESSESLHDRLRNEAVQADVAEQSGQPSESATKSDDSQGQKQTEDRAADTQDAQRNLSPESSSKKEGAGVDRGDGRDVYGRIVKKTPEQSQAPTDQPTQQQQPQPRNDEERRALKEQKDRERYDRNWEKLNERSAQILEMERQARERLEQLQRMPDPTQQPRMDSQQLLVAAEDFDKRAQDALAEEDYDTFNKLRKLAKETVQQANEEYQREQYEFQQQSFEQHKQAWSQNMERVVADLPELNDANHDLTKTVHELMASDPRFSREVDGFEVAVAIAQGRLAIEENSGLKDELAQAKNEITRLNKLLGPASYKDSTGHGRTSSDLSNMPLEQRKELLRSNVDKMVAF
jgi:hypothetical protein